MLPAIESERLVAQWNNLYIGNTALPPWNVLLFRVGPHLEYRVVGRDETVHRKGHVPSDDDSEYEDYLKNKCEPLIEPDLSVSFSCRILSWTEENVAFRFHLLRNTTALFWQVHDTEQNSRTTFPLRYSLASGYCTKRLCERIYNLSKMPIEEAVHHLRDLRIRELVDHPAEYWMERRIVKAIPLGMRFDILIDEKGKIDIFLTKPNYRPAFMHFATGGDFPGTLLEGADFKSRPFFRMEKECARIAWFTHDLFFEEPEEQSYTTTFTAHSTSYWGLNLSLTLTPKQAPAVCPQTIQGNALVLIAKNCLEMSFPLPKDDELKLPWDRSVRLLSLSPRIIHNSMFSPLSYTFPLSPTEWAVTLISVDNKFGGNHAEIVVEGIANQELIDKFKGCTGADTLKVDRYFKAFCDFTGARIRLVFTEGEIRYIERSPIMLHERDKVIGMLEYVLESSPSPPPFSFLGSDSSLNDNSTWIGKLWGKVFDRPPEVHNCFTWARETMQKTTGVDLGKALFSGLASLPRTVTHLPDYYKKYREEF